MTIAYVCDLMCMCVQFRDEILLRGEECKTWEKNQFFLKNGKMIISVIIQVENLKFFKISDDETDFTI